MQGNQEGGKDRLEDCSEKQWEPRKASPRRQKLESILMKSWSDVQPGTHPSRQASRSLRMLTEGVRDRVQNTAFRGAGELSQLKVKRQDRHCT